MDDLYFFNNNEWNIFLILFENVGIKKKFLIYLWKFLSIENCINYMYLKLNLKC